AWASRRSLAAARRAGLPYDEARAHHALSLTGVEDAAAHATAAAALYARLGCQWHVSASLPVSPRS
ncbi:MAG TPA: hypothetical protein PKU97_20360, partial [Kofleriaceae bacterium]|nr:hypothetical protein [Kofleriaceae bacterium]